MKKNTIIKALSLTMAFGVLLGTYGCKSDKKPTNENEPSSVTSIIEYTSINEKGKEDKATNVETIVDPGINKAKLGPLVSEKFSDDKKNKEDFKNRIEDFGGDDKKYEEVVKDSENWQTFTYDYFVSNPYPRRIAFKSMKIDQKDGILVDCELGGERGVASGKGTYIVIEGMVDTSKYKTEEEVKKALNSMNPVILYTYIDSIDDTVDDWSKVEVKEMPLDMTR